MRVILLFNLPQTKDVSADHDHTQSSQPKLCSDASTHNMVLWVYIRPHFYLADSMFFSGYGIIKVSLTSTAHLKHNATTAA
jgi:hypothetical protein